MSATRNNFSFTFIMIILYSHCGYAQYMKEFVGPLSLLPGYSFRRFVNYSTRCGGRSTLPLLSLTYNETMNNF